MHEASALLSEVERTFAPARYSGMAIGYAGAGHDTVRSVADKAFDERAPNVGCGNGCPMYELFRAIPDSMPLSVVCTCQHGDGTRGPAMVLGRPFRSITTGARAYARHR